MIKVKRKTKDLWSVSQYRRNFLTPLQHGGMTPKGDEISKIHAISQALFHYLGTNVFSHLHNFLYHQEAEVDGDPAQAFSAKIRGSKIVTVLSL